MNLENFLPISYAKASILSLALLTSFAAQADEGFLPGRIESRTGERKILAKCAARAAEGCVGYQFFYSPTADERDATPISNRVYTEASLKELKSKPVVFNLFDAFFGQGVDVRESGLYTVDSVRYLNDYEDNWGESVGAKIAYGAARGVAYGVLVPISAAMDIGGTAVAAPVTGIQVVVKYLQNTKINKLIRALKSGEKIPLNINRVYRLRDSL